MTSRQQPPSKPWYRQFWPWFVFALPLSSVIAGLVTVYIAFEGADSLVSDSYYKDGLAINRDIGRERQAQKLGVRTELSHSQGMLRIRLQQDAGSSPPALTVRFRHATRAERDFLLTASRDAAGDYRAELPELIGGKWDVLVEPRDQTWRLSGRWILPREAGLQLGGDG